MLFIPAIDIFEGRVARLKNGNPKEPFFYPGTPLDYALEWESQGATFLHIVDLDGWLKREPVNISLIDEICRKVKIPIEVGGGITNKEMIFRYFDIGVQKIVLSKVVLQGADFLAQKELDPVKENLVVSIDMKELAHDGTEGDLIISTPWADVKHRSLKDILLMLKENGIKRINFSDVSKDGALSGFNTSGAEKIISKMKAVSGDFFIVYAGGISSHKDIKGLLDLASQGLDGAIVGRALYEHIFSFKEILLKSAEDAR